MSALELAGVAVWYPPRPPALLDVDVVIPAGQSVAVLGANGSGKSLLLKVMAGALAPSRGTARIGGVPAAAAPGGTVAWLSADVEGGLVGATVRDHVNFFGPAAARVDAAWARFDLAALADRAVDSLSAGEKQRVALAGWYAGGAAVWILDEPTGVLDPSAARAVRAALRDLGGDGATRVVATHDWAEVALADRVLVLADGRLVYDGTPEALGASAPRAGIPQSAVAATGRALHRHARGASAPVSADPGRLVAWVQHGWS